MWKPTINSFMQHIPKCVEVDPALPVEFKTTGDLLSLDVVKQFRVDGSVFKKKGNTLMVIGDHGFRWWFVGTIKHPGMVDLPEWDGCKYRAVLPNGKNKILSDEVVSSCGNVLTLEDGSTAKNLGY